VPCCPLILSNPRLSLSLSRRSRPCHPRPARRPCGRHRSSPLGGAHTGAKADRRGGRRAVRAHGRVAGGLL